MNIQYPFIPEGKTIRYVPLENSFILTAKEHAKRFSLDKVMPTASVVVKEGTIIGVAANGSDYHEKNICERVKRNIPTGQGYELCEGCHWKNHSETKAVRDAKKKGFDTKGADLYLWGHWWCCSDCWDAMLTAGIKNVFLLEKSEIFYNKNQPDNIVGRQFEF